MTTETESPGTHEMKDVGERIREMLDGLEGVTPGPWFVRPYAGKASSPYRMVQDENRLLMCIESVPAPTAAHIARCDPDTMREILTLALSALSIPVAAQDVAVGEDIADFVRKLRNFETAYGEEFFGEVTQPELESIGPILLSRVSASMGRHLAKFFVQSADMIERLAERVHYAEGTAQANIDRADEAALASPPSVPTTIDDAAFDAAAAQAWDFVLPGLLERGREKGYAGVWSDGFRQGWETALRAALWRKP